MVNSVKLTLEDLMADVQKAADIIEVPVVDTVWDIMRVYEKNFLEDAVGFRITTQSKRELHVRYQTLKPYQNPYAIAVEHGFLKPTDHPIYALIPEMMSQRPEAGYFIDLGVTHGFEKIWGFFPNPFTLEEILAIKALPASVANYVDVFKKHGLTLFGAVAVNYPAQTVNLYWTGGSFDVNPEIAAQIVVDAGYPKPSDFDNEFNAKAVGSYMTFSWDSDRVERVSFCQGGPVELVPAHWPQQIHEFAAKVPLRSAERLCTFCTAYGHSHPDYVKFEGDYYGTIAQIIGPLLEANIKARAALQG